MGANHGGARTNAGRKTKFSEDKKIHVGLRCEQLHYDALKKQMSEQIYRFIHYDTEIGNEFYDIKRINKSKRNTFNSSPLLERIMSTPATAKLSTLVAFKASLRSSEVIFTIDALPP